MGEHCNHNVYKYFKIIFIGPIKHIKKMLLLLLQQSSFFLRFVEFDCFVFFFSRRFFIYLFIYVYGFK